MQPQEKGARRTAGQGTREAWMAEGRIINLNVEITQNVDESNLSGNEPRAKSWGSDEQSSGAPDDADKVTDDQP